MASAILSRPSDAATPEGSTSQRVEPFSDMRVFVACAGAGWPRDYLAIHQGADGPRVVMVGPDVSDERLERNLPDLSDQYDVTLEQLQAARDAARKAVQS